MAQKGVHDISQHHQQFKLYELLLQVRAWLMEQDKPSWPWDLGPLVMLSSVSQPPIFLHLFSPSLCSPFPYSTFSSINQPGSSLGQILTHCTQSPASAQCPAPTGKETRVHILPLCKVTTCRLSN